MGVRSSDADYHLLLRKVIRANNGRMPPSVDALALDERQRYPWLYHAIIARVPDGILDKLPGLPSAIIDLLYALLVFAACASFVPLAGGEGWTAAVWAAFLFLFSSGVLMSGIGPRSYEITARPLGELGVATAWTCTIFAAVSSEMWWIAPAIVGGAAALLASLFAIQVLFLGTPALALLTFSILPLVVLLGSIAAALLLSRGRYWHVLSGHLDHLTIYKQKLTSTHPALRYRNSWVALLDIVRKLGNSKGQDRRKALIDFGAALHTNSLFQLVFRNCVLLVVILCIGVVAWQGGLTEFSEAQLWMLAWIGAMSVPFVITSFRNWAHMGEPERYLEYAGLPICVLGGHLILRSDWIATAIISVAILAALAHLAQAYFQMWFIRKGLSEEADRLEVEQHLNSFYNTHTILPVPITLAFSFGARTNCRYLASMDPYVWRRRWDEIFFRYPLPSQDIDKWVDRFDAKILLAERETLQRNPEYCKAAELSRRSIAFENKHYVIYELENCGSPRKDCEEVANERFVPGGKAKRIL